MYKTTKCTCDLVTKRAGSGALSSRVFNFPILLSAIQSTSLLLLSACKVTFLNTMVSINDGFVSGDGWISDESEFYGKHLI